MLFQKKTGQEDAWLRRRQDREKMISEQLKTARHARSGMDRYWNKMRAYYDGAHASLRETAMFLDELHLPWQPAVSTDGFIQVESQIERICRIFPSAAETSFGTRTGRKRASANMLSVIYWIKNDMEFKNIRNERRLNLYGTAVWKGRLLRRRRGG